MKSEDGDRESIDDLIVHKKDIKVVPSQYPLFKINGIKSGGMDALKFVGDEIRKLQFELTTTNSLTEASFTLKLLKNITKVMCLSILFSTF